MVESMLTTRQKLSKRIFDVIFTLLILPIILLPIIFFWLLSTISIGGSGWFSQERIGKNGQPFTLYKIRTLKGSNHESVVDIIQNETRIGGWLRRTKLDELPQLFNILIGDMSWVGPRPDVPGYADLLIGQDRIILSVRPGLTGPATIKYKNEDSLLLEQDDPNHYNDTVIWPDKVKINKKYIKNWSIQLDIKYLWASIVN